MQTAAPCVPPGAAGTSALAQALCGSRLCTIPQCLGDYGDGRGVGRGRGVGGGRGAQKGLGAMAEPGGAVEVHGTVAAKNGHVTNSDPEALVAQIERTRDDL